MYKVTVLGVTEVESLFKSIRGKPLYAKSFNSALQEYRKNLITQIKANYTIRYSTARIRKHIVTVRYTKSSPEASLIIKYAPTPLAHFYVTQVRVGRSKTLKKVLPSTAGIRYKQSAGSGTPYTKAKVIKGSKSKLRLVKGLKGYKGFLQHKKGQVYERLQRSTWRLHQRLPYRPLYSLSVSQMAKSKRVQTSGINEKAVIAVGERFAKGVEELMS